MTRGRLFAAAMIMIGVLAGCSSESSDNSDETSKPSASAVKTVATCTTSGKWGAFPQGLKVDGMAEALGVSTDAVRNGSYGTATCDKAVSIRDMEAVATLPHVTVKGQGSNCIAVGSQEDPRAHSTTKLVIATCPES